MDYIMNGMWPIGGVPKVYLDTKPLQIKRFHVERIGFFEQPHHRDLIDHHRVTITAELPEDILDYQILKATYTIRGEEVLWQKLSIAELNCEKSKSSRESTTEITEEKSYVRIVLGKVKRRLKRYLSKIADSTDKKANASSQEQAKTDYERWCDKAQLTDSQMQAQKSYPDDDMPMLSVFLTNADMFDEANNKLQKQTYKKWEVINDKEPAKAQGDFIIFWNGIDCLSEDAFFEMAQAIRSDDNVDIIYSDDELYSMDGRCFHNTRFKPDYNLELLRSQNYIGDFFAVKKELVCIVGSMNSAYGAWMAYDYLLRCAEVTERVYHIPRILSFYFKTDKNNQVGLQILENHYKRLGLPAVVESDEATNCFYTRYNWEKKPLISIIIPNKDHIDDLRRCIDSVDQRSTYKNYEFVIVENNSEQAETFVYYEELKKTNPKVKVVTWKNGFNYSALNNFGAKYANGEYYLLLNNDTEIINEDCLEVLLQYCMREDVGAVGARLYYEDDTIQHAGVVIGMGGIAGHAFTHLDRTASGYMNRIVSIQEYTALTAACMIVKKEAYDAVGGLTEELAVAFNDIDFCLKLKEAGYKIIYNPMAELYHYESKSRGAENTPEKVARFHSEIRYVESRWVDILLNGDPNYNNNLTIDKDTFMIRKC